MQLSGRTSTQQQLQQAGARSYARWQLEVCSLTERVAHLQRENRQLKVLYEAAWQACRISHAIMTSYTTYQQEHQTLASILTSSTERDHALLELEQQAQQLLQLLDGSAESPHPTIFLDHLSAAAASASAAIDPQQSMAATMPLNWHTEPSQFIQEVLQVLDWSVPLPFSTVCDDTAQTIVKSMEPLVSGFQQAADAPTAAAAVEALWSYSLHIFASITQQYLLEPQSLAVLHTLRTDALPAEHLQHLISVSQLSEEQLQQVALLFGAFKQLSQPYVRLRQQLQVLLGTSEQSIAAWLGTHMGGAATTASTAHPVSGLQPDREHSSSGGPSSEPHMEGARVATPPAAAASSTRCSTNAASDVRSCSPSAAVTADTAGGMRSATAAAAAAAPCAGLPDLQHSGIQMTPEIGEQVSLLLDRVMRKLAWLEWCFCAQLSCLVPVQQYALMVTASPPYIWDAVAWAAHVAEQMQEQQQQQRQQWRHSSQSSGGSRSPPGGLNHSRAGGIHSGSVPGLAHPSTTLGSGGSGAGSCTAPTVSSSVVGPADPHVGVGLLCQALRELYMSPGPSSRAQLLEAAAAISSRRGTAPSASVAPQQLLSTAAGGTGVAAPTGVQQAAVAAASSASHPARSTFTTAAALPVLGAHAAPPAGPERAALGCFPAPTAAPDAATAAGPGFYGAAAGSAFPEAATAAPAGPWSGYGAASALAVPEFQDAAAAVADDTGLGDLLQLLAGADAIELDGLSPQQVDGMMDDLLDGLLQQPPRGG